MVSFHACILCVCLLLNFAMDLVYNMWYLCKFHITSGCDIVVQLLPYVCCLCVYCPLCSV